MYDFVLVKTETVLDNTMDISKRIVVLYLFLLLKFSQQRKIIILSKKGLNFLFVSYEKVFCT